MMLFFLEEGAFNPLEISQGFMFWSLITFGVTLFILWKTGWGPLAAAIEGRENKIREDIERAEWARAEAEKAMAAHKKELDEAAAAAKRILEEAREAGERARTNILEEARAEVTALKTHAERDIATAREKALADIKTYVVEVAMAVSRKVVSSSVDEGEHARLVDEALVKAKDVA